MRVLFGVGWEMLVGLVRVCWAGGSSRSYKGGLFGLVFGFGLY